jgi:catechol 2,3-dioxygenase-like lactoylglutathione lyase family enzyme
MLSHAKLQSIIWTSRIAEAEQFYSNILGLRLNGRSHGALVYDVGGSELRVSPVPSTEATPHTVLGFSVDDFLAVQQAMTSRGIQWECFPGFPHDGQGALRLPDGTQVAWFRDPDGNLLSIVQYAPPAE